MGALANGSPGKPSEFAGALRKAMTEVNDIELLFAIWEQNVETRARFKPKLEARAATEVRYRTPAREPPEAMSHRSCQTREPRQWLR
jgi:hypothetical protein